MTGYPDYGAVARAFVRQGTALISEDARDALGEPFPIVTALLLIAERLDAVRVAIDELTVGVSKT